MSHRYSAFRAVWAGSTALAAAAAFSIAVPATAQDSETAEATEGQLATIIVTANRVEQNLQDVPIAVSAVSGDRLIDTGTTSRTARFG